MSQSALSYTVSQLEQRLAVALLARTTRHVASTEAGQHLLATLVPAFGDIDNALQSLQELRTEVSGTVRLTMLPVAYDTLLRPILQDFFVRYPHVSVEVSIDEGTSDIVANHFDGGIRFGTLVEKDMVVMPLTRSSPIVIVGAPAYFESRIKSQTPAPTTPEELKAHRCISYRYNTSTRLHRWLLEKDGNKIEFKSDGQLVLNDGAAIRSAALDGLGLAYLFAAMVDDDLNAGRLQPVLQDWLPDLPGFSLYYPSRRRTAPAFRALIEHMRTAVPPRISALPLPARTVKAAPTSL
ncbi:MAG: LysR family transcriptional regulator [Pseudomonadota bacterium]|nr:LysR family transcriptional regulator [Pseudomonadota bacterium]